MPAIWREGVSPAERFAFGREGTLIGALGMEFLEAGDDWVRGRMPVDERTRQPYGFLHGGASVAFAETMASWGGDCCVPYGKTCMGMEINANHVRPAPAGWVYGRATPESLGRTSQVWTVRITNEADKLVCISRVTLAVVDVKSSA
ncbi:MAG: hotdog fold thioesterase [Proteobacteria bacterium]|nr:hotdog fold thioesterase [Pseudomonadota bacterium]MBW3616707.1 hotdog fold thioesterase [Pseudomonadota bacterium]